jgi:tetratricopeptide (TPR) repeat protein
MIDKEGNTRIMDFGIARSLSAKGLTGEGIIIGTPEYMSPEQAEAKEVDHKSDIYSLGIILYEVVTEQLPFDGETPLAIAMKHKGETPKEPKALNPQIPDNLNRLILRCLEKDKQARYESADHLLSDLTNIEQAIPTTQQRAAKKKPLTSKEITVTFSAKKLLIPAIAIAALILIALFLWQPWSKKAVILISTDSPSIAILYFENNSGDENLSNWRVGISDLLITDLSQSLYIQVLSSDMILSVLRELDLTKVNRYSSEDLEKVASRAGVNHVVCGSYMTSGSTFIINTILKTVDTDKVENFKVEGQGEESINASLIDSITLALKQKLDLTNSQISDDIDRSVGEITSSSPEAYKFYQEGIQNKEVGKINEAIISLEKAVALDPGFAVAFRNLSILHNNLGNAQKCYEYLDRALDLTDRLSLKDRLLIEGESHMNGGPRMNLKKAHAIYTELIELYPNLALPYAKLAWVHQSGLGGDLKKAISYYELAIEKNPRDFVSHYNVIELYRYTGLYEKGINLCRQYTERYVDIHYLYAELARIYQAQGEFEQALEASRTAYYLDPTRRHQAISGDIHLLQGDYEAAGKEYQSAGSIIGNMRLLNYQGRFRELKLLLEDNIQQARKSGDIGLMNIYNNHLSELLPSRFKNEEISLSVFDELRDLYNLEDGWHLEDIPRERQTLYWQRLNVPFNEAIFHLNRGSIEKAKDCLLWMEKYRDDSLTASELGLFYEASGRIAFHEKRYPQALDSLSKALEGQNHGGQISAKLLNWIAETHLAAGDLAKAAEEYKRITKLTTGRLDWGDIYVLAFYKLGKIYEEQGETAKAIENYEKFLDLWKDADPGLPEVNDARIRLNNLRETQ